jgi:hypothetical protein
MTTKQIQRKYRTITDKLSALYDQLKELQSECQHPNVDKKYKGSTGNYDPTSDCYWIDWRCPDCDKRWCTDQ